MSLVEEGGVPWIARCRHPRPESSGSARKERQLVDAPLAVYGTSDRLRAGNRLGLLAIPEFRGVHVVVFQEAVKGSSREFGFSGCA